MGILTGEKPPVVDDMGIQEMISLVSSMGYSVDSLSNEEIEGLVIEIIDGGSADYDGL